MSRALLGRILTVLCALVLGAGIVVAGAKAPAHALDDGPPRTALKKGERMLQKGRQGSYCWTSGANTGVCADYAPRFPGVDRVAEGGELYVRIFEARRPGSFELASYRKVDKHDHPVGRGQDVPLAWRRIVREGKTVAWDAVFKVGRPNRHYYLSAFGIWKKGDSSWYFHVKTRG